MTALHLDRHAHLGGQRNIPTHTQPLICVRSGKRRDIQAFGRCPGPIVCRLQRNFHTSSKQPERILPMWDILQLNIYMLPKSAVLTQIEVNRRTV